MKPSLTASCVKPVVRDTDLEFIWNQIDFAWQKVRKPGKFVDVSRVLGAFSDQEFPPLRYRWLPTPKWRSAEKLLSRVSGFSFHIEAGHFFHDDGAGERGRLSCRTTAFGEFVNRVLKIRPTTLEEVRELL